MATKAINTVLNLRDKFSGKMKQIAGSTQKNSKQMQLLSNNVQKYRTTAVSGFSEVAKKAAIVGSSIVGIGAAAATIANGAAFIQDYSSSLNNLQAATGATDAEMKNLKSSISDLYKMNMGESWSDLAAAMTLAKQVTGQVGDELKTTTALAVTYRDVFGEDISQSVKAADTMMKNFGITSSQAFNLLASGAQKGLDKSGELIDSANEYAPYFKTLGFSANEMFDVFSTGLEKGAFNLDKVGDAVKEFGIRIKDESKGSIEAFESLGLNADQMAQTFAKGGAGARDAFTQVVTAISAVSDPVKKNTIGVQLFGTMFEDLESEVISSLGTARSQFDMTKDTMGEINKIKYNSATQAFKGIGRLAETAILAPIADRVLPKLSEFGAWFAQNTPQIESAINSAFSVGADILRGFGEAISWTRDNADWLIPVVAGLTAAITAQKVIGMVTGLYKTWTTVTKGMTVAQIALNLATRMSPFGIIATIIGVVIAAGVALWKNWDTVKEKGRSLFAGITGIFGKIKTFIQNIVSGIGNWLNSFPFGQGLVNTIRSVIDNVKSIFNGVVSFFKSIFKGDWEGAWNGIVDVFKTTFGKVSNFVKTPINAIIGLVNGLIDKVNSVSVDIPDWVPGKLGGKTFSLSIPKIPEFALGTSYFSGGLARINERGGEIVNLPNGSQVIPADKSEKMIEGSRQQPTIQIIVQGNIIGEEEYVNRIMKKAVGQIQLAINNM